MSNQSTPAAEKKLAALALTCPRGRHSILKHRSESTMAAPIGHSQLSGSTVPQHSTFAHSKEDVLNALSFYFGQPVSPEKLKDYGSFPCAF